MKRLRLINPAPAGNRTRNRNAEIFSLVPLQLLTIGSAAPANWDVEIQDEIIDNLTFDTETR